MIALVDVDYRDSEAVAACVEAADWTAAAPAHEHVARIAEVADYQPGAFYQRELPCILAVLELVSEPPAAVVVDGYVWLDAAGTRPGLGAHLHAALDRAVPVVGIAKNPFAGAAAREVLRGNSQRPLLVTAVGIDPAVAAAKVATMHGEHRLPTLLGRVDRLARDS